MALATGNRLQYVVTDTFSGDMGWTPDKLAIALKKPMARLGIMVERAPGHGPV